MIKITDFFLDQCIKASNESKQFYNAIKNIRTILIISDSNIDCRILKYEKRPLPVVVITST